MLIRETRLYEEADPEAAASGGGGDPEPAQKGLPLGDPAPDEAIKKLEERLTASERSAAEREERLQRMLQGNGGVRQPQQHVDPAQIRQQINEQIWNNPADSITQLTRAQIAQAMNEFNAANFDTNRSNARREGREADPLVWKMYESEVDRYMADNYPQQVHANPHVWKHATEVVRGRHADEVAEAKRKQRAERDGPGAPSNRSMPANPSDHDKKLDNEEEFVASDIFHITPDKYREGRKFHADQRRKSDVNGRSMLKSAWAKKTYTDMNRTVNGWPNKNYGKEVPMITFDSDIQRPRAKSNG